MVQGHCRRFQIVCSGLYFVNMSVTSWFFRIYESSLVTCSIAEGGVILYKAQHTTADKIVVHLSCTFEWCPVIMERKILCWILLFGYLHGSSGEGRYSLQVYFQVIFYGFDS